MDDKSSTETTDAVRRVTPNQVVAWNIARYRREAGLTQKELGERLGWTNVAVSEAERSWEGRRTREFDANALVSLSLALSVPLIALFLPPDGDGAPDTYLFSDPRGADRDMGDLMALVLMPDSDDDDPPMGAYRDRLQAAATRYLDAEWAAEIARWLKKAEPDEMLADRAARLRARQAELAGTAAELGDLASAIENQRRRP